MITAEYRKVYQAAAIEIARLLNGKANNSKRTAKLSGIK